MVKSQLELPVLLLYLSNSLNYSQLNNNAAKKSGGASYRVNLQVQRKTRLTVDF